MPEGMRGDNFNFINAYAITLFMVCELQHTHYVNMANMFHLSLCVTLFFVFLNHALCLESKLCNVSFIMDDDIKCDCSARGLKSIPRISS
jgi:hypothetical protein